jgi:hypothetical protein
MGYFDENPDRLPEPREGARIQLEAQTFERVHSGHFFDPHAQAYVTAILVGAGEAPEFEARLVRFPPPSTGTCYLWAPRSGELVAAHSPRARDVTLEPETKPHGG